MGFRMLSFLPHWVWTLDFLFSSHDFGSFLISRWLIRWGGKQGLSTNHVPYCVTQNMVYVTMASASSLRPVCVSPQCSCSGVSLWRTTGASRSLFSGLHALWKCHWVQRATGVTMFRLHGSRRPWMCHPDAHKNPLTVLLRKEKRELSIPYLHFKRVKDLGILDLIKWTSEFRMVGSRVLGSHHVS